MNAIEKKLSKIAAWFQPAYNKIDAWDLPWLRAILKDVWGKLDESIKKSLYDFITAFTKKYGEDKAKELADKIKAILKSAGE
jgi:hypothetical protein